MAPALRGAPMTALLVAAYLLAIVLANLLVATYGPAISIVNAFVFVGLDLTTRDRLHDVWGRAGRGQLLLRMGLLIAAGGLISYQLNAGAGAIAVASTVAFALASIVDTVTYHLLRWHPYMLRTNGSNIAAAAVDSIVFPTLAFGALLPLVVVGQFSAKVTGGYLWAVLLRRRYHEPEAWELEYQTGPDPEVDW